MCSSSSPQCRKVVPNSLKNLEYHLSSSCLPGIRNSILDTYPDIGDYLDSFLPKKDQFKVVKCHDHVELLINSGGDLLFWRWVVKTVVMTDDDGDDDGDD